MIYIYIYLYIYIYIYIYRSLHTTSLIKLITIVSTLSLTFSTHGHAKFQSFSACLGLPGTIGVFVKCRIMAIQRREVLTHLVRGIGARNHPEIGETRTVYKVSGVVEIGLRRRPTASGELKIGMSRRSVSTAVRAIGVVELGADSTAVRARGVVVTTLRKTNRNLVM
jgi:hypothetical protein